MPPSMLPPIFPHGPLNLNPDGTTINYKKSHAGPNANHWIQADAEEMARLFNTGTIGNWTTIDLTDFYLGTDLPHPEYIRIQSQLVPDNVTEFYKLRPFMDRQTLYCSVHKTHYGLPQAGALSQQRLFKHLLSNGYYQVPSRTSVFRNKEGTIRFTLVVDDFAVLWTNRAHMDHFIETLTRLYQVKVNWAGTRYLGMDITIN
jgi:hypothetical protein